MRKVLYLGTDRNFSLEGCEVIHYPVILLVPKSIHDEKVQSCLKKLSLFTHCFLTSKNAVDILFTLSVEALESLREKCISIGPATSAALQKRGIVPLWEAAISSQEGMIEEMQKYSWENAYIFYPRSSLARSCLASCLDYKKITYEALDLYDTRCRDVKPTFSLEEIDEIIFTSPSTVKGFFKIFSKLPEGKKLRFQGPITEEAFYRISLENRDVRSELL
ncbi:MAG: uroporphyrinogen-III synthase [Chlamydiota bacterium]